jgi:hypothetical protein
MQGFGSVREQNGYGFFRRRASKCFRHCVAPELHAHHANGGGARCVGDSGDINIEGSNRKVGIAGRRRDEGLQDMGRGVIGSEAGLVTIEGWEV